MASLLGAVRARALSALKFQRTCATAVVQQSIPAGILPVYHLTHKFSEKEFDACWLNYFNREDIDSWELRMGVNELYGHDLVPEPVIISAMLKAARRLNDLPVAIRILEAMKEKAGGNKEIIKYVAESIKPTLDELGLNTPEELGLS